MPIAEANIIDAFRQAMAEHGIVTDADIVADGDLRRIHVAGDRCGSRNGWYILHVDDKPAGAFGSWRLGGSVKWSDRRAVLLTREQRRALAAEAAAKRAAREAADREGQAAARVVAEGIWKAAHEASDDHPYLRGKGVKAYGLSVGRWERFDRATGEIQVVCEDALLVPLKDATRQIHSLQAILPAKLLDGRDKDFLPRGAKDGHFHDIGEAQTRDGKRVFILGEGYATCASVHEATGHMVLVCFDAGNLGKVAAVLRQRQPEAIILFAADNDLGREDGVNAGVLAAVAAAKAVSGLVAVPVLVADPTKKCDFNDLHQAKGLGAVAGAIEAALAGVPMQPDADEAPATAPVVQPELAATGETVTPPPTAPTSRAWSEPVDPFGTLAPTPIPMSLLPKSIGRYAADQASLIGCDASFIGMAGLVAAASVIDDGIVLQVKRRDPTWLESARLWGALVGDPSTAKSPAIAKATRHVRRLNARLVERADAEYAQFREKHDDWKQARKQDRDAPEPKAPPRQRAVVEDSTVEALSEVLKDNDRGVLCVRDELSGWIGSMDGYKAAGSGADRAAWLETYNGGPRSIDRVTRGSIHVKNWSCCMLGGIQPDTMRRIAKNIGGDGLLQRFMPIIASSSGGMGEDRAPDHEAMRDFEALFDQLEGISPGKQAITMSEAAHLARERVDRHAREFSGAVDSDHMKAWFGKWPGLFARLVLTFHVIECAEAHVHPSAQQVRGATAEKVERLMCGFLLHHAIHFYTNIIDAHDRQMHVRQLARLVLAKGWRRVTMRDISRMWKAERKLEPWETRAVIDSLVTMGWLEPDAEDIGLDRRPRSWDVNPMVHEVFAKHAARERVRRQEVAAKMRELREYQGSGAVV